MEDGLVQGAIKTQVTHQVQRDFKAALKRAQSRRFAIFGERKIF
jgi:hypothetical protein